MVIKQLRLKKYKYIIYSGNIFKKALPDTNIIKCIIEIINGIKHIIIHIFNFLLSFLNLLYNN